MRKIYLYCSILFILSLSAYAQKETYNWFYGSGQGITWNKTQDFEGIPTHAPTTTVTLKGIPTRYQSISERPTMYPISTREGCFSLSDENGNLLFYSSGTVIYNANHQIMENATGLSGNSSSAQSGIIVPMPRNNKQYVAVTIGVLHGLGALRYQVLDLTKNNGLGRLVLPKNRPFTLPEGAADTHFIESLAATKHANGVDYWIVAVQRFGENSKMVAWLLTENGIIGMPVTSAIPNVKPYFNNSVYGYLKISPNGKYFALMMYETNNLLWGEFNNRTGEFSNMYDYYSAKRSRIDAYGGEFSPDSKYLYVSSGTRARNMAFVFDFQELLNKNVNILRTFSPVRSGLFAGAMQLGPDLRLYMTMAPESYGGGSNSSTLYMFENPNEPLTTAVYALNDLSPGTGSGDDGASGTRAGLPTFASSFFVQIEGTSTQCIGEEAVYTISSNAAKIEIDFDEGDGPVIIDNVPELRHSFKKPGTYLIQLRPLNNAGVPIQGEVKSVYTTVYSCYLPINHNLINADY